MLLLTCRWLSRLQRCYSRKPNYLAICLRHQSALAEKRIDDEELLQPIVRQNAESPARDFSHVETFETAEKLLSYGFLYSGDDEIISIPQPISNLRHSFEWTDRWDCENRKATWRSEFPQPEPLTLTVSSKLMRKPKDIKSIRRLLRSYFMKCHTTRDVMLVAAVAIQRNNVARQFTKTPDSLYNALYRAREYASDRRIAACVMVLIQRMQQRGYRVEEWFYHIGIKFAARSRDVRMMERFLWQFRTHNVRIGPDFFRSIISKFSIGARGLGEIRNGRWKKSELVQILLGFENPRPGPAYHLGSFLNRESWWYISGWITVLSRCRQVDQLWQEWQYWLNSNLRLDPTAKRRGGGWLLFGDGSFRAKADTWFIRHMLIAGSTKKAWRMFEESGLRFLQLDMWCRNVLLEHLEHASPGSFDENVRLDLLRKYTTDLQVIETRLGVRWVQMANGQGYHLPTEDFKDALETLSRPDFFKVYGYFEDNVEEEDISTLQKVNNAKFWS